MLDIEAPNVNSARMRHAGKGLLSLALMDARNHTLRWMAVYEEALAQKRFAVPLSAELNPPLWELGHLGWFQEWWIARNVQRQRGTTCDPTIPRLASIEPDADRWYDSGNVPHDSRWHLDLPDLRCTKQFLADIMDVTLELLEGSDETDDALYFYRLALFHEDMHGEAFATMAQTLGLEVPNAEELMQSPASHPPREPLLFPATRWSFGSGKGGFVFDNEKWAHEVSVPEFEIDAQPVSWAQYSEFVEDGGYDEEKFWSSAAWAWLQSGGRRTPRHVDQMRQGVLQQRFGRLVRVPLSQAASHVSGYEAKAWCRWAGRRLPTEVEWEVAAHQGAARGFRWGDVWEWTSSNFRPFPGFSADPYLDYSQPWFGNHQVLRGASFATRGRMRSAKYRNFYLPWRDDIFSGFRSCAV